MVAPNNKSPSKKDGDGGDSTTVKVVGASPKVAALETKANDEVNDRARFYKEEGNRFFGSKDYEKAATAYKLGLALYHQKSSPDHPKLEIALRSNLAMALLKREKYEEARTECDAAIAIASTGGSSGSNTTDTVEQHQPKLWYRRALAQEGLENCTEALADLKHCLALLERKDTMTTASGMQKAAQDALERIQRMHQANTTTSDHDYVKQRQTVVTLLQARKDALAPSVAKEGEAFFLLDWSWWQQWCHKVHWKKTNDLLLLPSGATDPTFLEDDELQVLDAIDNSCLLLPHQNAYSQHWFPGQELKPNLVRGYDYEVIPREVYHALVTWYGESSTHSICRRWDGSKLQLYPPAPVVPASQQRCGACRAPHAKSRCRQCMQVYYCGRSCQESHWSHHKTQCGKVAEASSLTGGRNGRVGLHNLGNTCFMNSALQCLSHATPLTRHFLSQTFLNDLNISNPLGTGGKLAHAYNQVLREIWMAEPAATSPTTLKRAIAMFAPRFAGCSQHDAQEFLAYLLDGLHEDLNRIRKAPYVELPDVDQNSDMKVAGAKAWNAHRRRNDSLVLDSFYGQFKSTCVCPQCRCVSVSFDAFNHVSLGIPQPQSNRFLPILVFSQGKAPIRWMVEVPRGSFVADLRNALAEQCGIAAERLALCDLYEYAIYEILQDNKNVNAIRTTDVLAAFDVDPYTNATVHVIATHSNVFGQGSSDDVTPKGKKQQRDLFGFPFLTSFPADRTCKQVYEHIWEQVSHVPGVQKEWVQVLILDNNGKKRPVFEGDSAVVPSELEDKIIDYLGKECTERFLFVSLEWNSESLDKSVFVNRSDHISYQQGLEKERGSARGVTLDQCFQTFTRPERLDENNMWYCKKCKEHVRALKTMELWRLPNVLVVHLKRFEFKHALRRDKLDTFVDFDVDGLDMSKYCGRTTTNGDHHFVQDKIPALYDLFAVTNHFGRMGFGHYTAFARSWDETTGISKNNWALFDDSSVRGVTEDSVVTPAGYVLFYRRRQFN